MASANPEKAAFGEPERAAHALSDGRGNVVLLSTGWLTRGSLIRFGFADSSESDATYNNKKSGNAPESHFILRALEPGYFSA